MADLEKELMKENQEFIDKKEEVLINEYTENRELADDPAIENYLID